MDNPYQSPQDIPVPEAAADAEPVLGDSHWVVTHVRVVAWLLLVEGALELLMTAYLGVLVYFGRAGVVPFDRFVTVYTVMAVACFLAAVLKIVAGLQNLWYRGRLLGFVALGSGALVLLTMLCAPSALIVGVYGLIVYLQSDVRRAFQLGSKGKSVTEIWNAPQSG